MACDLRPLFGEAYYEALLLLMVLEHCVTMKEGELKSYSRAINADVMRALAQAGLIDILEQVDDDIVGVIRPEGRKLEARFLADQDA